MAAQGVLALGIVLVVVLLILVRRTRRTGSGGTDECEDARRLIGAEIEAHIDALAESYAEASLNRIGTRPGVDRFSQEVELFIADVLLPRIERAEPWLREEVREIVVLERDDVYTQVRKRVEAHLRQAFPVEGQAQPPESSGI